MSTAEITAYLAGVEIGRSASVIVLDHGQVSTPEAPGCPPEVLEACKGMHPDEFRRWLLRGVGDAFKQ